MNLLHSWGNSWWELSSLTGNQGSCSEDGALGLSPNPQSREAAEEAWWDWQLRLLILDLENNSQGAGVRESEAQCDEADGTWRENFTRPSSQVPLPDPLRHDKRWSGSHFYRDSFPPGCIWRRRQPQWVLLFGKKKKLSFLNTSFQIAMNRHVLWGRR